MIRPRHLAAPLTSLAILLLPLSSALAQQAGGSKASQEVEVTGGDLMLVSYLVFWALIAAVVIVVLLRQRRLQHELDALERRLDQRLGLPASDGE